MWPHGRQMAIIHGNAHAQNVAYFGYTPNRGLAVAALCCFLLVAAISTYQNIRYAQ